MHFHMRFASLGHPWISGEATGRDPVEVSCDGAIPPAEKVQEAFISVQEAMKVYHRSFVSPSACSGALCEAAGHDHEEEMRAKASPSSDDGAGRFAEPARAGSWRGVERCRP